jgi:two-component system sensor histidine kinase YesM
VSADVSEETIHGFIGMAEDKIQSADLSNPLSNDVWSVEEVEGAPFLACGVYASGLYCGAWIGVERFIFALQPEGDGVSIEINAADDNDFAENVIASGTADVTDADGQRYFVVTRASEVGDFIVSYKLARGGFVFRSFYDDFAIAVYAVLVAIILFVVGGNILWQVLFRPLLNLQSAMVDVREGNISPKLKPSWIVEYRQLNQTFEYMMDEIKTLKIDVYEQRLGQQRTRRKFLQIQLKSHFYLNCLNIINSLAIARNYDLIVDLTCSLGAYFRYMADDMASQSTVASEVEHARNYMHIQEIRFPSELTYIEEVAPETLGVHMPTLIVQTFIENAIIHALDLDNDNLIRLSIGSERRGESDGIAITIEDNGKGFAQCQLDRFNAPSPELKSGKKDKIGIINVLQRLELIYGGKASVHFSNADGGGAVVRLWLPDSVGEEGSGRV